MFLPHDTYRLVVESTPVVTLDFICANTDGDILLGKRTNKPAKGYYFTPGGRIFKGERMEDAFIRLSTNELGKQIEMHELKLRGVYQHFFEDSIFEGITSHFINIAFDYTKTISSDLGELPTDQHQNYRFFSLNEIFEREDIHSYVSDYFKPEER